MTNMTAHVRRFLIALSIVFFLAGTFLLFTGPISDGDFFWQVKTGEWIWQHQALPQTDPFSAAASSDAFSAQQTEAGSFILKGYWLAQILFYGIDNVFGPAGIIFLRATIYTGLVGLILAWTRKKSGLLVAFVAAFLLAVLLREFPGERPQIFTFLMVPLTLWLLERVQSSKDIAEAGNLALPFLMLVWSNLHGGYALGFFLILIYAAGAVIKALRSGARLPLRFLLVCFVSLAITLLNPNTYHVLFMLIATASSQTNGLHEYLSPVTAAVRLGEYYFSYYLFSLGAVFVLFAKFKKMDLTHLMVIVFLGGLSLSALRFMPYFLMTAPLICLYLDTQDGPYDAAAIIVCTAVWIASVDRGTILNLHNAESFPEKAVSFIRNEKPEGRIFNYYTWGGYLIRYLPEYPAFIDGRGLAEKTDDAYHAVLWSDAWENTLDEYGVKVIVMPGISLDSGTLFPLTLHLFEASEWYLVYQDDWSLVFVKKSANNQKIIQERAIKKELLFDHILAAAAKLVRENPRNSGYWRACATAQFYKGDFGGAVASYRKVLKLAPHDDEALAALARLGY
jgi:hypothetical protein